MTNLKIHKLTGKPKSVSHKLAIALANKGVSRGKSVPKSPEHRRKIAEARKSQVMRKGYKLPKSHGEKVSKALTGRTLTKEHRQNIRAGLHKAKDKMVAVMLGRFAGNKHWNWKGGISPENNKIRQSGKYKAWIRSVFTRNNYTCKLCNKRGSNLEAHHIKAFAAYPHLRFDINNGITLCCNCHKKVHNNMITIEEILKVAIEPVQTDANEEHTTPVRKAYDAVVNGAQTAGGALVAGVAGLNSLDQHAPMKTI